MNGSYSQAKTNAERMAIAAVAANALYFRLNKRGVVPGYGFYEDFFEPFAEEIELLAQKTAIHDKIIREGLAKVEVEIEEKLIKIRERIKERLGVKE